MMSSDDCVDGMRKYLAGGACDGFGGRDPFAGFSGGGSAEGLAKTLASGVTAHDCPDGADTRFNAMLFADVVSKCRTLTASDLGMIKRFMEIAYEEHYTSFKNGLSISKEERRADEAKSGAHGGKIPSKSEADSIVSKKGMPWQEVVAVSSVMYNGTVPTLAEIELEGYGSDPGQWQSAKEWRKNGKPSVNSFLKNRDAAGYRNMLTRGATRMAANGAYSTGAAQLMLFIGKLSKMTFDQGMPGLFLDYCEEHMETHKGYGLASAENPLDPDVLTETVLAEKSKNQACDERVDKVISQIEELAGVEQKVKSRLGEISALASKVTALEAKLSLTGGPRAGGPPSAENVCSYCRSPDHFVRDCPKKREADERRAAAAAAASSGAGTSAEAA